MILNILRPRTDESQDVRFAVREKYPLDTARQPEGAPDEDRYRNFIYYFSRLNIMLYLLVNHGKIFIHRLKWWERYGLWVKKSFRGLFQT